MTDVSGELRSIFADQAIVIIGEMHGNRSGPESLLTAANIALDAGYPVTVGLEAPELDTEIFREFLDSAGGDAEEEKLFSGHLWKPDWLFDGRANVALVEALETLRAKRAGGADIDVFGFQRWGGLDDGDTGQNAHEQRMADAVVEEVERNDDRKFVLLCGNVHASRAEFDFGRKKPLRPMALRIAERVAATKTINLAYSGGTTWALVDGGLRRFDLSGREAPDEWSVDPSGRWDYLWPVGEAIPSPPAHPDVDLPAEEE